MTNHSHSPQDELYGPLDIPKYCWKIIDTPEYQRMRYIQQLGCASMIWPCATHTRFEHCLGVGHLAQVFMRHISEVQPEIEIKEEYVQAVVIAGLTHDLGHGPWSHCFEEVAHSYIPTWDHEEMSCLILKHIVKKYNVPISDEVIEAACCFIKGEEYPKYPKWLSRIVSNSDCDIDLDKFDYLARDMNRSICTIRFEYDRLIFHCKVVDNQLSWKISEISTIERMFFNRNDMHQRVYQHRVNQAYRAMVKDMLEEAEPSLKISKSLRDPELFCKFDCRIQYLIETGACGEKAKAIAEKMSLRQIYKCIGEIRLKPDNNAGLTYSQLPSESIGEDFAEYAGIDVSKVRVAKMKFRYGLKKEMHPLLYIPFWKPGHNQVIKLKEEDISCIIPAVFAEMGMRLFVTDPALVNHAVQVFDKWKEERGLY